VAAIEMMLRITSPIWSLVSTPFSEFCTCSSGRGTKYVWIGAGPAWAWGAKKQTDRVISGAKTKMGLICVEAQRRFG